MVRLGGHGKPDLSHWRGVRARRRATLTLWLQLLIAIVMVPILALTHGLGLMAMSHMFNLTDEALLEKQLSPNSMVLVAFVATCLFALHALEITALALVYVLGHAARGMEDGLAISASYYTTTGSGSDVLPAGWRIVGLAESLLGLLLIGWSTAYLVRKIERLAQERYVGRQKARQRRLRIGVGYGGHEAAVNRKRGQD